jgi:hypothetical protein
VLFTGPPWDGERKAPEGAGHAQARGGRADRQPLRHLRVRKLVEDAQLEGAPLVLGQRAEAPFEREPRREPLLDRGVAVVGRQVEREAEPFARAGLDAVAADGVGEHVGGDSQQPGQRRAGPFVAEAASHEPGAGEGLRRQVARRPVEPPPKPAIDGVDVAHVQLAESGRIRGGGTNERGVGAAPQAAVPELLGHYHVHRAPVVECIPPAELASRSTSPRPARRGRTAA